MKRRSLLLLSALSMLAAVLPAPPETEKERRARILRENLATPEGRKKLAEAMHRDSQKRRAELAEAAQGRKLAREAYIKTQESWDRSGLHLDPHGLWEYRENLGRWVLLT